MIYFLLGLVLGAALMLAALMLWADHDRKGRSR
jgi:hypothetical protein